MTKAPLLACVVLDIDWNTPIHLQTQARTLVDEQATFTGINKNGLLVWEFEFHNCTEAELMLVRILLVEIYTSQGQHTYEIRSHTSHTSNCRLLLLL